MDNVYWLKLRVTIIIEYIVCILILGKYAAVKGRLVDYKVFSSCQVQEGKCSLKQKLWSQGLYTIYLFIYFSSSAPGLACPGLTDTSNFSLSWGCILCQVAFLKPWNAVIFPSDRGFLKAQKRRQSQRKSCFGFRLARCTPMFLTKGHFVLVFIVEISAGLQTITSKVM